MRRFASGSLLASLLIASAPASASPKSALRGELGIGPVRGGAIVSQALESRLGSGVCAVPSAVDITIDPSGYVDSVNLYAPMRWDVVNNRDPSGEQVPPRPRATLPRTSALEQAARQAFMQRFEALPPEIRAMFSTPPSVRRPGGRPTESITELEARVRRAEAEHQFRSLTPVEQAAVRPARPQEAGSLVEDLGIVPRSGVPRAKRGPKTDENEPHNATIRRIAQELSEAGNRIEAGGRVLPERLVPTQGGAKSGRRPDIIYRTPGGQVRGVNVGLTNRRGEPITREREALEDLEGPGGLPMEFIPYTKTK